MKIYFYLRYHTHFGQSLALIRNDRDAEGRVSEVLVPMVYLNEEFWLADLELDARETPELHYKYRLTLEDGTLVRDGEKERIIEFGRVPVKELHVTDTWNYSGEYCNVYYTAPFQEVLLPSGPVGKRKKIPSAKDTHVFRVKAPQLKPDEILCMLGSCSVLSDWNTGNPCLMQKEGNWWTASFNLRETAFPVAYKYGVYNARTMAFVRYEEGNNRVLFEPPVPHKLYYFHDGYAWLPHEKWRGTGVSVPVFGLRSRNGMGVGEFADLVPLANWASEAGMKMIQILPVNDTTATHTWSDSYPYAAISAFALHPLYINLEKVAGRRHAALKKSWKLLKQNLNNLPSVDYEQVMAIKWKALREMFERDGATLFETPGFRKFFEQHSHWLVPYAVFCYYRDKYRTADYSKWKTGSEYNEASVRKLTHPKGKHFADISFHYFIQYHLHLQLEEAVKHAHKLGIVIKGDIPIGIYRHSADAWVNPSLYNMDMQAGAPPDSFAVKGQNWGFPTYNWSVMQKDNYGWWRRRFEQMSHYFDAFRIDHILGFFRIWSIPMHAVEGILGHFVPALPLRKSELENAGISFDYTRYCEPYINDQTIQEIFGADSDVVKENFLDYSGVGLYRLKPAFATQRLAEAWFADREDNEQNRRLRQGLYDLIADIILLPDEREPGETFHFRFAMYDTASFRQLEPQTQGILSRLYEDYFFRRQDNFWKKEAMRKLPDLKDTTNMLICGEDLGLVPACVPGVMKELAILSLEIQRMPKAAGAHFFHPAEAPYLSVVTPGTHDMSTIRGWWEEDRAVTQDFYNNILGQWGDAPWFCEAWINKAIILQHLYSPAMWCILQIQDLLGIDERLRSSNPHDDRINVPANPRHYWRYRMHIPLEDLINEKTFTAEINTYIRQSGRY